MKTGFTLTIKIYRDIVWIPKLTIARSSEGNPVYVALFLWWGVLIALGYAIKLTNEQPEVRP